MRYLEVLRLLGVLGQVPQVASQVRDIFLMEPVRNVKHAKKLLDEFHALHPEAPQPIALNNPRPISREFNREIWFEVPRGSSALKRG